MKTYRVANWAADGLHPMTDKEWAERVDTSPPIGAAYKKAAAKIGSPMLRACESALTYGNVPRTVSGTPRGEPHADGMPAWHRRG